MYKSLDIRLQLCTFALVNVTIDAQTSIFNLYSIGSIYKISKSLGRRHTTWGFFIFPEFFLTVMVVCRLTPLGYADFNPSHKRSMVTPQELKAEGGQGGNYTESGLD